MAAQVLSGSGNVSYTNSTGQNVRIVINWLNIGGSTAESADVSFGGATVAVRGGTALGKSLAFRANNIQSPSTSFGDKMSAGTSVACPTEVALANGDTFSITHATSTLIDGYNIIIIPEAG